MRLHVTFGSVVVLSLRSDNDVQKMQGVVQEKDDYNKFVRDPHLQSECAE